MRCGTTLTFQRAERHMELSREELGQLALLLNKAIAAHTPPPIPTVHVELLSVQDYGERLTDIRTKIPCHLGTTLGELISYLRSTRDRLEIVVESKISL